jgi:alkylated DNA repair dioxygenase AlkB
MHEQIDIFAASAAPARPTLQRSGELPDDFVIVPDFLTKSEEYELLRAIDAAQWNQDLKRRVQHYGFRYDYKARAVSAQDRLGALPDWALDIAHRLVDNEYFANLPDQVIVNEYEPGQGINAHTDRTTCFGPTVASLSLGSDIVMDFTDDAGKSGSLMLPRRSMLILRGSSRASWRHGIAQRRRDTINEMTFARGRRVSLTFRTVIVTH